MKAIRSAAEAFLAGSVDEWLAVADAVRQAMIDLAELYVRNAYFLGPSGNPAYEIFDDAVRTCFFDPELVRKLTTAPTPREFKRILCAALMDAAEEISEENGTGEHIFYRRDPFPDMVLGPEFDGTGEPFEFDPDEPIGWIPYRELTAALDAALTDTLPRQSRSSNYRSSEFVISELDFIDLALYRALTEHPDLTRSLPWRTFERLLADMLEEFGFEVELTQGTKDGGIDVIAIKNEMHFGVHRYLLQAKRWTNKVGIEPVQRLLFLQSHHQATKSCLVTTSTFTSGAWQLADQYRWQLELRDYNGLMNWIQLALASKRQKVGPSL